MQKQVNLSLPLEVYNKVSSRAFSKEQTPSAYVEGLLSQIAGKITQDDKKNNALDLDGKVEVAKKTIACALAQFPLDKIAIAFTGGKDSTLLLWLIREVCQEKNFGLPKIFFIDEGDVFDEIKEFVNDLSAKWDFELAVVHNSDVSEKAKKVGDTIQVDALNERNKREVKRLGYGDATFPYEPESYIGNHLMKTVAMNMYLEEHATDCFFEGIRWDEQQARAEEVYFSKREGSEFSREHLRVFPILHFSEREVWNAIFKFDIPYCSLYEKGYRSLGARCTTTKTSDLPAWEQDLENTTERSGRRQDKEGMMKKLRALGYM